MPDNTVDQNADQELLRRKGELRVIAYSCHRKTKSEIAKFLDHCGVHAFSFYEYFCPFAVKRGSDGADQPIPVYAPFVERVRRDYPFLPVSPSSADDSDPDKWVFVANTAKQLSAHKLTESIDIADMANATFIGRRVYEQWKESDTAARLTPYEEIFDRNRFEEQYLKRDWSAIGEFHRATMLRELKLTGIYFWLQASGTQPSRWIAMALASQQYFYGYVLLIFPDELPEDQVEKIRTLLAKLVEDSYLPTLILFANSCEEAAFEQFLDKLENPSTPVTTAPPLLFLWGGAAEAIAESHPFERHLNRLWTCRERELRKVRSGKSKDTQSESAIAWLRQSLIFSRYFIASPGMLSVINQAMELRPRARPGGPLPTALIYGEPGSGKEQISRMIPLMSDDYARARIIPINMAALRPSGLVPGLLAGVDIGIKTTRNSKATDTRIQVAGLFQQALDLSDGVAQGEDAKKVVFILDELNSLDLDSQGILLRVIETGLIQPIGGLAEQEIAYLIIGIVNEPPEELTYGPELRNLLRESKLFGELPRSLIHELVRRTRRLRDDLYYRLRRGGELRLPALRERPEDIPILFYRFVRNELDDARIYDKDVPREVKVELEAFDVLMDPSLRWQGNVRELQLVAKEAVQAALNEDLQDEDGLLIDAECVSGLLTQRWSA